MEKVVEDEVIRRNINVMVERERIVSVRKPSKEELGRKCIYYE